MINNITMENIACYKERTVLNDLKELNIIYGLNGSGKTTLSNFFYIHTKEYSQDNFYKDCKISNLDKDNEILVYNQKFINENFFETNTQKGIFTLSTNNKDKLEEIDKIKNEINKIETQLSENKNNLSKFEEESTNLHNKIVKKIWEIKTKYEKDNVFEKFLEQRNNKEKFFNFFINIQVKNEDKSISLDQLSKQVQLFDNNTNTITPLPKIEDSFSEIETSPIMAKEIIGRENSSIGSFINELKNSDWVYQGFQKYINPDSDKCPFCQKSTLTQEFIDSLNLFFDDSYKKDLELLYYFYNTYSNNLTYLEDIKKTFFDNEIINKENTFFNSFSELLKNLQINLGKIKEKLQTPSIKIKLIKNKECISDLNKIIENTNLKIEDYNKKIGNKKLELENLKNKFWKYLKIKYNDDLDKYEKEKNENNKILNSLQNKIVSLNEIKNKLGNKINILNSELKNIESTIEEINKNLISLGISSFKISKCVEKKEEYELTRENIKKEDNIFKTLSEGEKTIISFLYFMELCKNSSEKKKIIVIDDPISSLSHIFIFNISQFIKNFISSLPKNYEQIFILTHSLYFLHELAKFKKINFNYYRIENKKSGSIFSKIEKNKIQNEYQSYWEIIKDKEYPNILIGNCMRNILECFFGFIMKKDLDETFNSKKEYNPFYRFINRESHYDPVNIYDFKEYDYATLKIYFKDIFERNGFINHYEIMMGENDEKKK